MTGKPYGSLHPLHKYREDIQVLARSMDARQIAITLGMATDVAGCTEEAVKKYGNISGINILTCITHPIKMTLDTRDKGRLSRIIDLRERGFTYGEVGARVRLTRERVRQILLSAGRHDLCGSHISAHRTVQKRKARSKSSTTIKNCRSCGVAMHSIKSDKRIFCSTDCWKHHVMNLSRVFTALRIRARKKTWAEVAMASGYKCQPDVCMDVRRLINRVEDVVDLSWAMAVRPWRVNPPENYEEQLRFAEAHLRRPPVRKRRRSTSKINENPKPLGPRLINTPEMRECKNCHSTMYTYKFDRREFCSHRCNMLYKEDTDTCVRAILYRAERRTWAWIAGVLGVKTYFVRYQVQRLGMLHGIDLSWALVQGTKRIVAPLDLAQQLEPVQKQRESGRR